MEQSTSRMLGGQDQGLPPGTKACSIYRFRAKTALADDDTIARGLIVNSADESVCGLNFKPPPAICPEAIGNSLKTG